MPASEYRVNNPTDLIEIGLSHLKAHGEISVSDWKREYDEANLKSYYEYHLRLGKYIGVLNRINDILIIDQTAVEEDLTNVAEATFHLTTRFPLFRRWLKLQVESKDHLTIESDELTIIDTRDSVERKRRPDLYANWLTSIENRAEGETDPINTFQMSRWIVVCDEFLGKQKSDRRIRGMLLICLCAAREAGAAVNLKQVTSEFNVQIDNLETTIDEVLTPLGVPIDRVGDLVALKSDLLLQLEEPENLLQPFIANDLIDGVISQDSGFQPLIKALRLESDIFEWRNPAMEGEVEIRISEQEQLNPIFSNPQTGSMETILESLYNRSKAANIVSLPLSGEIGGEGRLVAQLRNIFDGEFSEAPVSYRSRTRVLGSLPLFEYPEYTDLTDFAEYLKDQSGSSRESVLQAFVYSAIPSARVGLLLCDCATIRQNGGTWVLNYRGTNKQFSEVLKRILEQRDYTLVCVGDAPGVSTQFVQVMQRLNMVRKGKSTEELNFTTAFKERLQNDELVIFSQYKEDEQTVRSILNEEYV